PVYRLDTQTFKIKRLPTTGDNPGWIYKHRAIHTSPHEIQITGGKIVTDADGKETHSDNAAIFTLNTETLVWQTKKVRYDR
ncbi:MAG: ankyrin repeat domain-containing protein, partial [Armatimonadota bacterium]|nr:ankyrin repeat domain-containing protein [Armatimonadota bacterium]